MSESKKTHPSYGRINIVRSSGCKRVLFGSSIEHGNTVTLIISPASIQRHLHRDWIYGNGTDFIEVEMTMAQWANMVSSVGVGEGTPCTVRYLNGEHIEGEKESPKKTSEFLKEFNQNLKGLADNEISGPMKRLNELVQGLNVSQKAKKELEMALRAVTVQLSSNLPFVAEQFSRFAEHTTAEMVAEQEASAINMLIGMGLDSVREKIGTVQNVAETPELAIDIETSEGS